MSDEPAVLPSGLFEVSRLAAILAERVLDAQIMNRPVPEGNIRALLEAALLLRDYDQEPPALLGQIIHGATTPKAAVAVMTQQDALGRSGKGGRIAQLLRPFQASKG